MIMQVKARFPIEYFVASYPIGRHRFFMIKNPHENEEVSDFRVYKMELEPKRIEIQREGCLFKEHYDIVLSNFKDKFVFLFQEEERDVMRYYIDRDSW